jgi:RNA polymerase sigma-70 factor (ECF subfamily)
MPQQPSPHLIERAAAGDRMAFRHLVEGVQGFLYGVAFRLLGEETEAEDAVQETLIKTWKHLPSYRNEVRITTWLYRIITHHCLDRMKSAAYRQRQQHRSLKAAHELIQPVDSAAAIDQRDFFRLVQEAATALPEKQKVIFVLRDLEGLEVAEVMAITELTEDQIKSNLYLARKRLQEILQPAWLEKND